MPDSGSSSAFGTLGSFGTLGTFGASCLGSRTSRKEEACRFDDRDVNSKSKGSTLASLPQHVSSGSSSSFSCWSAALLSEAFEGMALAGLGFSDSCDSASSSESSCESKGQNPKKATKQHERSKGRLSVAPPGLRSAGPGH